MYMSSDFPSQFYILIQQPLQHLRLRHAFNKLDKTSIGGHGGRFLSPLWGVGATYAVHLRLIGNAQWTS